MVPRHALWILVLAGVLACDEDDAPTRPRLEPIPLPPPNTPEALVQSIEIIYEDTLRTPAERLAAYANLLGPSFIFRRQTVDQDSCGASWGRETEIEAHSNMFKAQKNREIYSLRLEVAFSPARDLDPPDPSRPGWKSVFAGNVFLELLTDPNSGFVINGAQAEFLLQPVERRWFIGEWRDLPRPNALAPSPEVEPVTWGRLKASFLRCRRAGGGAGSESAPEDAR